VVTAAGEDAVDKQGLLAALQQHLSPFRHGAQTVANRGQSGTRTASRPVKRDALSSQLLEAFTAYLEGNNHTPTMVKRDIGHINEVLGSKLAHPLADVEAAKQWCSEESSVARQTRRGVRGAKAVEKFLSFLGLVVDNGRVVGKGQQGGVANLSIIMDEELVSGFLDYLLRTARIRSAPVSQLTVCKAQLFFSQFLTIWCILHLISSSDTPQIS